MRINSNTTFLHIAALLLLVVVFAHALPAPVLAADDPTSSGTLPGIPADPFSTLAGGVAALGGSFVTSAIISAANWFMYLIMEALALILAGVAQFTNWAIHPFPLTTSTFVQVGWHVTRDFTNSLFILILLGIALDFILFNSFSVKRMLPRLLIIALLINFSLPIAGIFIDFANVFSNYFISQVSDTGGLTEVLAQNAGLQNIFAAKEVSDATTQVSAIAGLSSDMFFAIFYLAGMLFIFLALGLMFLIRTGFISFLLIIMPVVLVLSAFPPTQSHWGRWEHSFIKWVMFAPAATFFLYLSALIFSSSGNQDFIGQIQAGVGSASPLNAFVSILSRYIIIWALMLGSIIAASQMGIYGASTARSIISKTGRWARGTASHWGKRTVAATARSAGAQEGLNQLARGLEKISPLTLGLGRVIGAGVRGGAARVSRAVERTETLTPAQKANFNAMSEKERREYVKNLEKSSVLPGVQSQVAELQADLGRRGELLVKDAKGNVLPNETKALIEEALARANTYAPRNKKIRDDIMYSSGAGVLVKKDQWLQMDKEGKLEKVEYEKKGTGIMALSPESEKKIGAMQEGDKRKMIVNVEEQQKTRELTKKIDEMDRQKLAQETERVYMAKPDPVAARAAAQEAANMNVLELQRALSTMIPGTQPGEYNNLMEQQLRPMAEAAILKEKRVSALGKMTTDEKKAALKKALIDPEIEKMKEEVQALSPQSIEDRVRKDMEEEVMEDDKNVIVQATEKATGKTYKEEVDKYLSMSAEQLRNARGTFNQDAVKTLMEVSGIDSGDLRRFAESGNTDVFRHMESFLQELVKQGKYKEYQEGLEKRNRAAVNDMWSGSILRFVNAPKEFVRPKAFKKYQEGETGGTEFWDIGASGGGGVGAGPTTGPAPASPAPASPPPPTPSPEPTSSNAE